MRQRSVHIHGCCGQEMARILERVQSELRYCYDCFHWFVEEEWEEHCLTHLKSITSRLCGSIQYCNILLRPYFCPFCIGNDVLPAASRWKSWTREEKLRKHLEAHLEISRWPLQCPHPLCSLHISDEKNFLYHLSDSHSLKTRRLDIRRSQKQTTWGTFIGWNPKDVGQKRNREDEEDTLLSRQRKQQKGSENSPKEIGFIPPILPSEESTVSISQTPELASSSSISLPQLDMLPVLDTLDSSRNKQWNRPYNEPDLVDRLSETDVDAFIPQSPDEGALFSQFLRSRSPSSSRDDTLVDYNESTASSPPTIAPQNMNHTSEDRPQMAVSFDHPTVDPKTFIRAKPRIKLKLGQPNPHPRPMKLRLSQPKHKTACNPVRRSLRRKS